MFDLYDNDFDKAFDEAVDAIEKKEHRLIWADALKRHYAWWKGGTREMTMDEAKNDFDTIIDLQPTVEAEPNTAIETVDWYHQNADGEMVLGANSGQQAWFKADDVFKALKAEPKHGHWDNKFIPEEMSIDDVPWLISRCSVCKKKLQFATKVSAVPFAYCPNCGAKMDGEENG